MNRRGTIKKGIMLAVISVCLLAIIGGTYSRYTSTGTANASVEIAKWHVKLNGTDMSTTPVTKEVDLTYAQNSFVKDGKIAPGRKATFDIELNPTGSEVAIDYKLKVDTTAITGIPDTASQIAITSAKYKIGTDGTEQTATITGADGVTINEALSDVEAGKVVSMTVTLEWENDETLNAHDTKNGVEGTTITVPVTVIAEQHIS